MRERGSCFPVPNVFARSQSTHFRQIHSKNYQSNFTFRSEPPFEGQAMDRRLPCGFLRFAFLLDSARFVFLSFFLAGFFCLFVWCWYCYDSWVHGFDGDTHRRGRNFGCGRKVDGLSQCKEDAVRGKMISKDFRFHGISFRISLGYHHQNSSSRHGMVYFDRCEA